MVENELQELLKVYTDSFSFLDRQHVYRLEILVGQMRSFVEAYDSLKTLKEKMKSLTKTIERVKAIPDLKSQEEDESDDSE